MVPLDEWLAVRGEQYAALLDVRREHICRAVTERLMGAFPSLCYDPTRPDAAEFQQLVYERTPRRFHRLIQVVLRLQSVAVIEREYRWGWPILQRYHVERVHLIAHIHWYFEAARKFAPPERNDRKPFALLEAAIVRIVHSIAQTTIDAIGGNGHQGNLGFAM